MIWGHLWKKYRKFLGYAALFFLPFAAFLLDEVRIPKTLFVQKMNSWIVYPTTESIHNSFGGIAYIFKNYVALMNVKQKNDELGKENAQLKLQILQMQEIAVENHRLADLLDLKKATNNVGKVARVIGEDASPDRFTYLLNLGSKDGVEIKAPVLTPDGIVGQIREIYDHTSLVVTLLDPSSVMDVVDVRSRSHALVEGTGRDYLAKTKFVDRIEDFEVGDLLLSSGIDGSYPKGFPVGTIVEVQKPALGVLQTSLLRPAVDFDKLEEVLILPAIKNSGSVQVSTHDTVQGSVR